MSTLTNDKVIEAFNNIIESKGTIAPIAEKVGLNFKFIETCRNQEERLHYFAVGHAFKNIDKKTLFDLQYDETKDAFYPKRFEKIYNYKEFTFKDELNQLLGNFRNLNSHYVHNFNEIKTKDYKNIIPFLVQCFEVAVIISYVNEKNISLEAYFIEDNDKNLVKFIADKFHFENDDLKNCNKNGAIRSLLFINNPTKIDWFLYKTHNIFEIEKDTYFSLIGQLFLLSLFLYKGEAEQLISKVKGFKRTDDNEKRSKRAIFTFFAKKFSSQDVNSEETHLINFRDIIQFLSHYPTPWNKVLELESRDKTFAVNELHHTIINMEIDRLFNCNESSKNDADFNKEHFYTYVKYKVLGKKYFGKSIETLYLATPFSSDELEKFYDKVHISPALQNAYEKQKKTTPQKDKIKLENEIAELEQKPNPNIENLQKRIADETLITSYGRNKDRFMDFACRYLAETNYFGDNAQFKLYAYFTENEQNEAVQQKIKTEQDQTKYHKGKVVHFETYQEHLKTYPYWNTPFVIENNAMQLKLENGKYISIQRALMVYLLEHALYGNKTYKNGEDLFTEYLTLLEQDKIEKISNLTNTESLSISDKAEFKKLFPRRLLRNNSSTESQNEPNSTFKKILQNAEDAEKRHNTLLCEVKKREQNILNKSASNNPTLVEDFLRKNKGKNFKLRFLKKAWHLMYFKEIYTSNALQDGHHKRFHITKEEYNDFCRYMFAFDEVKTYKNRLNQLFEAKGFLTNSKFKQIIDSSNNLDDMYNQTKPHFADWVEKQKPIKKTYQISDYLHLVEPEKHITYINLSHFIQFLRKGKIIQCDKNEKLIFSALQNKEHLLKAYYLRNYKRTDAQKLYDKLNSVFLEDCYLYEIAMKYLQLKNDIISKTKSSKVNEILNQDISLEVKDKSQQKLYSLIVPFNKLDAYTALMNHKNEQEDIKKNKGTSFLANLKNYLLKAKYKDLKETQDFFGANKAITYPDLLKINNHVINESSILTKAIMQLEAYFIFKNTTDIVKGNRIEIDEIKTNNNIKITDSEKGYFTKPERNKSFHFGLPLDKGYKERVKEMEEKFLKEEVLPTNATSYQSLSFPLKSGCNVFLENIHNNYFNKSSGYSKRNSAETTYFNYHIKQIRK